MALPGYDIDFYKMISQLLGKLFRKPVRIAWLLACLKGLRAIHDKFLAFTNSKLDEVKYNGQTFVMEKMLQAKFGAGITITNNTGALDNLLWGDGSDVSSYIGDAADIDSFISESYDPPTLQVVERDRTGTSPPPAVPIKASI